MSSTTNITITRAKLAAALLLISAALAAGIFAQQPRQDPRIVLLGEKLDEKGVAALIQKFSKPLNDIVTNKAQVKTILDKWNAHKIPPGSTRGYVLMTCIFDVQKVVDDYNINKRILDAFEKVIGYVDPPPPQHAKQDPHWLRNDPRFVLLSEKVDEKAVADLIQQFSKSLNDILTNKTQVKTIVDKWNAHKGLPVSTKGRLMMTFFDDVTTVVEDYDINKRILDSFERVIGYSDSAPPPSAQPEH